VRGNSFGSHHPGCQWRRRSRCNRAQVQPPPVMDHRPHISGRNKKCSSRGLAGPIQPTPGNPVLGSDHWRQSKRVERADQGLSAIALYRHLIMTCPSKGLFKKQTAPAFIAVFSTASSGKAVMKMIGMVEP
jgi:hypothetical protein